MKTPIKVLTATLLALFAAQLPAQTLNWQQTKSSPPTPFGIYPFGSMLLASTQHGLMRSTDDGDSWASVPGVLGTLPISRVYLHESVAYATIMATGVTDAEQLYRSTDGLEWDSVSLIQTGEQYLWNDRAEISFGDVFSAPVSISFDEGKNWSWLDTSLDGYAQSAVMSDSLIMIDAYRLSPFIRHWHRTTDLGTSWQEVPITDSSFYLIGAVGNTVYGRHASGAFYYRSEDQGNSWTTFASGLRLASYERDSLYFQDTTIGLVLSGDRGRHLNGVTSVGLPNFKFDFTHGDGIFYAAFADGSIFRTSAAVAKLAVDARTSSTIRTGLVYPNPCSRTVRISIPSRPGGSTNVTMFNALGQVVVRRVVSAVDEAEPFAAIDISGMPSGVYSIRISANAIESITSVLVTH